MFNANVKLINWRPVPALTLCITVNGRGPGTQVNSNLWGAQESRDVHPWHCEKSEGNIPMEHHQGRQTCCTVEWVLTQTSLNIHVHHDAFSLRALYSQHCGFRYLSHNFMCVYTTLYHTYIVYTSNVHHHHMKGKKAELPLLIVGYLSWNLYHNCDMRSSINSWSQWLNNALVVSLLSHALMHNCQHILITGRTDQQGPP